MIPELQKQLPTAVAGGEPLPEGLLWLLLTGEMPTKEQAKSVTEELHARAKLPAHVEPMIRAFPKGMHPMTQLSSAILALQTESVFASEYAKGTSKKNPLVGLGVVGTYTLIKPSPKCFCTSPWGTPV